MQSMTAETVRLYYDRFNAGDWEGMLAHLSDDVAHDLNQGGRETGKAAFRKFLDHMNGTYREQVRDLAVMVDATGARAAAEFNLDGTYVVTDGSLPQIGRAHV